MSTNKLNSRRLLKEDVDKPCKNLALFLLGKILVRNTEKQGILKGRIVETEAYLGGEDKGSHSYNDRRSAANEPMYMSAGTCYVYMTYGMYHCFNISSKEPGAAVLIRALQPLMGIEEMQKMRAKNLKSGRAVSKLAQLCNGPSKLCISLDITKNCNKLDITDVQNEVLWLEDDPDFNLQNEVVISCPRIGIKYAGDWISRPLRYYIFKNEHVSKRDKKAEKEMEDEANH